MELMLFHVLMQMQFFWIDCRIFLVGNKLDVWMGGFSSNAVRDTNGEPLWGSAHLFRDLFLQMVNASGVFFAGCARSICNGNRRVYLHNWQTPTADYLVPN